MTGADKIRLVMAELRPPELEPELEPFVLTPAGKLGWLKLLDNPIVQFVLLTLSLIAFFYLLRG